MTFWRMHAIHICILACIHMCVQLPATNDSSLPLVLPERRNHVVGAAELKAEDALLVLTFQKHRVARAFAQHRRLVDPRLYGHVIHLRRQYGRQDADGRGIPAWRRSVNAESRRPQKRDEKYNPSAPFIRPHRPTMPGRCQPNEIFSFKLQQRVHAYVKDGARERE